MTPIITPHFKTGLVCASKTLTTGDGRRSYVAPLAAMVWQPLKSLLRLGGDGSVHIVQY